MEVMDAQTGKPRPKDDANETIGFREKYELTDGGQSDNFGLLALMERDVDLIVVSDAAYDPKDSFGDLEVVDWHAQNLLHKKILIDGKSPSSINEINALANRPQSEQPHIREGIYTCQQESPKPVRESPKPLRREKDIYYVKPDEKLEDFKRKLRDEDSQLCGGPILSGETHPCKEVYRYLRDNMGDIKFPDDKTMAFSYDGKLISAYYLLGKYLAIQELGGKLKDRIQKRVQTDQPDKDKEEKCP